jgi:hypothetical protein
MVLINSKQEANGSPAEMIRGHVDLQVERQMNVRYYHLLCSTYYVYLSIGGVVIENNNSHMVNRPSLGTLLTGSWAPMSMAPRSPVVAVAEEAAAAMVLSTGPPRTPPVRMQGPRHPPNEEAVEEAVAGAGPAGPLNEPAPREHGPEPLAIDYGNGMFN